MLENLFFTKLRHQTLPISSFLLMPLLNYISVIIYTLCNQLLLQFSLEQIEIVHYITGIEKISMKILGALKCFLLKLPLCKLSHLQIFFLMYRKCI